MNKEPIFELKPKYIKYIIIGCRVRRPVEYSLFAIVIFCWFLLSPITLLLDPSFKLSLQLVFFLLVAYLLAYIPVLYLDKKSCEDTRYKVYEDRIEIRQGFIRRKHIIVKMVDIKKIYHTQNGVQQKNNVGTIEFIINANNSNLHSTNLSFVDIENSNYIYEKVKQIYDKREF